MQITSLTETLVTTRLALFRQRESLTLVNKIALALGMAALTGLAAQIRVPLPFTPVPVTGQTFAVLLAGVLLGRNWGGISMALYLALGVAGIPWFAGLSGGVGVIFGPTGGYLIGFVLAALFLGYMTDRYIAFREFWGMSLLMLTATFLLIFIPGVIQLGLWYSLVKGASPTIGELMALGVYPFVAGGLVKIALAATVAKAVTPKENFTR